MTLITGNTYPVKEQIKALGGKWNRTAQGWMVPDESAQRAREIVAAAPPAERQPYRRFSGGGRRSHSFRFSSGATAYQNRAGRCEDAPCCGCCS